MVRHFEKEKIVQLAAYLPRKPIDPIYWLFWPFVLILAGLLFWRLKPQKRVSDSETDE